METIQNEKIINFSSNFCFNTLIIFLKNNQFTFTSIIKNELMIDSTVKMVVTNVGPDRNKLIPASVNFKCTSIDPNTTNICVTYNNLDQKQRLVSSQVGKFLKKVLIDFEKFILSQDEQTIMNETSSNDFIETIIQQSQEMNKTKTKTSIIIANIIAVLMCIFIAIKVGAGEWNVQAIWLIAIIGGIMSVISKKQ